MHEVALDYLTAGDVYHVDEAIQGRCYYLPVFDVLRAILHYMDRSDLILVYARVSFDLKISHHFKG